MDTPNADSADRNIGLSDRVQGSANQEWEALLKWGRAHGKALGIESEEDVERMCDEFRREKASKR